jgi:hypothetical protein
MGLQDNEKTGFRFTVVNGSRMPVTWDLRAARASVVNEP